MKAHTVQVEQFQDVDTVSTANFSRINLPDQ